jgi:hypothetical protein
MRIDHTGKAYGAVSVGTTDPINPRMWMIHWHCCGNEESISNERAAAIAREPPHQCRQCQRAGGYKAWTSAPKPPKPPDPPADLSATAGSTIPGRGFWPVLKGPMGMRFWRGVYNE